MQQEAFEKIVSLSAQPEALKDTVAYLTKQLEAIIIKGEAVLICFPREDALSFASLMESAVRCAGGNPVFWETDQRWNTLLRLAFTSRASTIIAPPLTVLGLSKLAAYRAVPLFIQNVVLTSYPCLDWMMDGIVSGLDCKMWGVLSPKLRSVIAGFSCACGRGLHVREDCYNVEVLDEQGMPVPQGTWGNVVLSPKEDPSLKYTVNASAMLRTTPCPCGSTAAKLVGIDYSKLPQSYKFSVIEELLYWNSILDCWVERTEYGLELEVVCFPGLKLPRFPSCAKMVLRNWNPETDIPFEISKRNTNRNLTENS